jgi:hypothetical protein
MADFDYTICMLDRYDDLMSQKAESERDLSTGPRPERSTSTDRVLMSFRVEPLLLKKLQGLAAIENGINKHEKGPKAAHISANAQLHYILEVAVKKYEDKYGAIPASDDEAGVMRHVKARTK